MRLHYFENIQLGQTYLAVEQMGNSSTQWRPVYVDTDWSTIFRWKDANIKAKPRRERNVITALFEMISRSQGVGFDYEEAMRLYERGLLSPDSLSRVISGGKTQHRYPPHSLYLDNTATNFIFIDILAQYFRNNNPKKNRCLSENSKRGNVKRKSVPKQSANFVMFPNIHNHLH